MAKTLIDRLAANVLGPDSRYSSWRIADRAHAEKNRKSKASTKSPYKWGWPTGEFPVQKQLTFGSMTDAARKIVSLPESPLSPFSKFVGNRDALERLSVAVYSALGNSLHKCNELAWAFFAPSSTGKTYLANLFAKSLALPFVEINSHACKSTDYILEEINKVLMHKHGFPLVFMERPGHFIVPPLVLFIDEVHELPSAVEQGLLTATEYDDGMLATPKGYTADMRNVTWVIATTEAGDLFGPFANRFTAKVELNSYTYDEVARIVSFNHPDWNNEICRLVAKYSERVPRTAKGFARELVLMRKADITSSWAALANKLARLWKIDKYGMSLKRVAVLTALGKYGPMSAENLCGQDGVNCQLAQLKKDILPPLLSGTSDQPRLAKVGNRGVEITDEGLDELEKRDIEPVFYLED